MERLGKLDFDREIILEFNEVVADINLGCPIMALTRVANRGHVVIIVGYIDMPGEDNDQVIINDSAYSYVHACFHGRN